MQNKKNDELLRIWVAGCSSGEEVYSIAITLSEFLRTRRLKRDFRIFATDISEPEIQRARKGIFPSTIKTDVSPERLKSFFTRRGDDYQILKVLRENCIFAKHDLISEAPFSQMDFISCCNVLIYLTDAAQRRILTNFHYSLKPKGILLLGRAESTNSAPNLFEALDSTNKVHLKRMVPSIRASFAASRQQETKWKKNPTLKIARPSMDWEKEADRLVLEKYKHSGLLIDGEMQIIAFRGDVTPFLETSSGQASLQLLKMVRKDLRIEMRMLHQRAKKKMIPIRKEGISFRIDGGVRTIDVEEVPIQDRTSNETVFLILFDDAGNGPKEQTIRSKRSLSSRNPTIVDLRRQYEEMKEDLRSGIEDQIQLNEELATMNEELESANEELQSSNEEFESAKEQLESTNEELATLNEELQTRNVELDNSNAEAKEARHFAEAVVETVLHPLVTLDKNLTVKEANASFYEQFRLSRKKVEGEYFLSIDNKAWDVPELRKELQDVFGRNVELKKFSFENRFPHLGRRILLLNARRIARKSSKQEFVLLAIEDITDRKRKEDASSVLIKDIHHRVKNNLQVITSLLGLQARFIHDSGSAISAFKESANRVRSMALIHEKLYESDHVGKMYFSEYVQDLAESLFQFYDVDPEMIRLEIDVENVFLSMDQAIPCGLIINELLSNTLKHAFPEGSKGKITLVMRPIQGDKGKKHTRFTFSVCDNGKGLPRTVNPHKPESLGLKIIDSLVKQLNGSFKVERNGGTCFHFTFAETT